MTEDEYYELMYNMPIDNFTSCKDTWYAGFTYMMKGMSPTLIDEAISSLFWNWDMENWKALHKENSGYKDYTDQELLESFKGECSYIADRYSYDRVFRAHQVFRWAWSDDIDKVRFPNLFKDK